MPTELAVNLSVELVRFVCESTGATGVQRAARVQALWEGYGEILRVALVGGTEPTVIVKWVREPPASQSARRSHDRKLQSYEVERAFYASFAARCGVACRVPRALATQRTEGGWLFVLEDLDGAGYSQRKHALSKPEIAHCLGWLAHFHASFLGVAPTGLWEQGTYWHLATRPDELARMTDRALREAAPELDQALRACPFQTLVHGDAKVENFCFGGDGAGVAAVDFQYVGQGVGVRDVCYLLSSCVPQGRCASEVPGHLDTYFVALRRALEPQKAQVDVTALEAQWRRLFPLAWADFYRFLLGWSPDMAAGETYGRQLAQKWLKARAD